jgi:hypothetical protein
VAKIVIGDNEYEFDTPEHFTFGELFDVEQKIGADAGSIGRAMGSLWIAIRRKSPSFTFEQLRDVVFDADLLNALNAEEDDESPPADGPQAGAKLASITGGANTDEPERQPTPEASGTQRSVIG